MLVRILRNWITYTSLIGNIKLYRHSEKQFVSFIKSYKRNPQYLPHDLAVALMDIYHRKIKTYVPTKTFTWMFIAPLFIITPNCIQPRSRYPSIRNWLNKLWHISTMECHSIIKRNKLFIYSNCMNVQWIMLNESSQSQLVTILHELFYIIFMK